MAGSALNDWSPQPMTQGPPPAVGTPVRHQHFAATSLDHCASAVRRLRTPERLLAGPWTNHGVVHRSCLASRMGKPLTFLDLGSCLSRDSRSPFPPRCLG